MTKEEVIEELKGCIIAEERGKDGKPNGNITCELTRDTLDMAIKALEQEPTDKNFTKADIDAIVKAINEGWELRVNEILSKIRAEILEEHENAYAREDDDTAYGLSMALDILDKYKAESEGKE